MFSCDHMHSLQCAPSPRTTLVSVRTIEFRFGIVHVGIENRAIGAYRHDVRLESFPSGDRACPARLELRRPRDIESLYQSSPTWGRYHAPLRILLSRLQENVFQDSDPRRL